MRRDDQRVDFNSRPSARGDECDSPTRETAEISIHAPPRGATGVISPLSSCVLFQFTPLCEGRQVVHKPQKTAVLFQFTPLREGRPGGVLHNHQRQDFNSRPSARGDVFYQPTSVIIAISIHAPPRGATCRRDGIHRTWDFNSRPSARGDFSVSGLSCACSDYFNSRPSARGDGKSRDFPTKKPISIHAPPRGATVILRQSYLRCFISIHAPPRGATLEDLDPSIIISIHAPPRGATGRGLS